MVDPAVISFECSKTSHVPLHRANHARNASNGFKEYDSIQPHSLVITFFRVKTTQYNLVKTEATELYSLFSNGVSNAIDWTVCDFNFIESFHRVNGMGHSVALWIHHHFVLWQLVEQALSYGT